MYNRLKSEHGIARVGGSTWSQLQCGDRSNKKHSMEQNTVLRHSRTEEGQPISVLRHSLTEEDQLCQVPSIFQNGGGGKASCTPPLDLSGLGSDVQKRETDSPLDLSLKTRKRCADSTDEYRDPRFHQLVMQPMHGMPPPIKRVCTYPVSQQQNGKELVRQQPQSIAGWDKVPNSSGGRHGNTSSVYRSLPSSQSHITSNVSPLDSKELTTPSAGNGSRIHSHIGGHGPRCETMCEGHSPGATGYKRVLNPELIPRQACQNLLSLKQVKEQSTSLDPMTVQQQGTTHMKQDIRYPSQTVNHTSQMTRTYNQTSRSQYLENRQRISNYTPEHLNSSNTSIRSERNPIHAMEKQVMSHESRPYISKQSELSSSHSVRSDQRSVISQQISASSSLHTEGQRNMTSQQKMACLSVNESSYAPKPKSFPSNQLYAINPFSDDVNDRMYIEQNAQTHVRPRQVKDTNVVRYESNYGATQSIFSGATHRCSPDSTNGMLRKESISTISQYPEEHKLLSEANVDPRNLSGLGGRFVDTQSVSGNGRQIPQNQLGRQMNFIGSFIPQSGPRHDVTKQLSPLVGAPKSPLPSNGSIRHPAISTVPAPKDNTRMNRTLSDSSSVPQVPKLIPNKPRDKPSSNRPMENTRTDMKADRDAVAKSILQTFSTIPLGPNFCTTAGASGRSITKGTSGAIKPEQRSKMETLDSYITRAFQELDESERKESKRTVSILEAIKSSESKTDVSGQSENRSVGIRKETDVILTNDKKDDEKIKSEGTVMTNFSTLLSIAIPSSVSASSSVAECGMNKPGGSIPNPKHYSKKHKILNAVKQDEDLKEMVETNLDRKPTIPPPPPPSSVDILKRMERQIPSGGKDIETDYLSCPGSPKMPILSPQENQATPSTVSPAIREPPTLEPPTSSSQTCILDSLGKHFSKLITDAVKGVGVFAEKPEKDPNICVAESCLIGQETDPQPDLDVKDKTAGFSSGTFPSKAFLSRQNSVTKNIPVANVAPIVHGKVVEHQEKENADSKMNGPEIIKRSEVSNAMFTQHMLEDQSKITRNVWTSFTYHGSPKESFKISHPFSSENEFSKGSGSTLSPGASDGKEFTRTPVIKKKMLLHKHSHEKRCPTDQDMHSDKDSMDLSIYEFKKDNYSVNDKHNVEQPSYQHMLKNVSVRSSHEYKLSVGTRRDEDSLFQSSSKGLLKTKAKNTNRSQRHVEVKTLREKSACPRPKASSIRQKADKLRRRARQQNLQKQVPGKRKSFGARLRRRNSKNNRGFVDFQPEVLRTRTRNQTAGRQRLKSNSLRRLNSSSASPSRRLSRELYRSPRGGSNSRERKQIYNRNKNASRKRDYSSSASRSRDRAPSVGETEASPFLSQDSKKVIVDLPHSNRSQRTADLNEIDRNRNSDSKIYFDKERRDELEGRWEIKGATSTLKQTLRSGKSKGGLMLKIYRRAHDEDSLYDEDTEVEEDCSDRTTSRVSDADDEEADEVVHIHKEKKVTAAAKKKSRFHFKQKYIFQKKRRHRKLIGPNKFALNSKTILQIGIPQQDEEGDNLDDEDAGSMESGFESIHLPRLAINKDSGETLLHRAARLGYEEIALKCLASGSVDVNARDNAGYTPLHECCARGDLVIARHLLNHGADVNCCSQDGIRPIHDAVETDQVETVRLLLSYGADPCISTYAGKTPLKLAKSERMRALITGYLGDLNGFECESDTQTWEFGTSSKYLDRDEDLGQDVFSDMPSDPEDESEDMLDVSSKPQFLVFHIASDAAKRTDDFLLLSQILEAHGLRRNDLDHIGLPPLMIKRIDREKFIESQKDSLHIESYTSRTREQSQFEIVRRVEATLLFAQMEKLVGQNSIQKSSLPSSSNLPKKIIPSFFKYDTQASPSSVDDQDRFLKDVRVENDGSRSQVTSSKRHSLPTLPKFKFGKRASEGPIGKRANEGEHKNDKHDRKSYVLKCKSLSANNSKHSDQRGESELKLKIGKLPKKQFDAFEFEDDDSDTLNNNEADEKDRVPCQSKSDS